MLLSYLKRLAFWRIISVGFEPRIDMDMTNDEISLLNEVRPKRSFSLKVWDNDLPRMMVNRRISIQNIRSFKSVRRTSKWFLFKFSGSSGIEDRSDALEALTWWVFSY